ncbi:MAG TPA: trypsin-like peptidase domain-containing protein [Pirellulales bacterium]|nr:trypsin-like peptidase domain-containing protein [Pirellulales bacterium]
MHLHAVVACLAMTGAGQTELLDFTASWCGPCRQMAPVVESLAAQGNPIRKVDYDSQRDLVARYNVTAIPCFVMLVDGQEVDRAVGNVGQARLQQMLSLAQRGSTAGAIPRSPAQAPARLTSAVQGRPRTFAEDPAPAPADFAVRGQSPDNGAPAPFAPPAAMPPHGPLPGVHSPDPLITSQPSVPQGPHRDALAAAGASLAINTRAAQQCLASSVRLRIADADGNSVGSGTIIDAREGEALVLTCGHVFRESKGQGRVTVDMFGPGAPKNVVGQVIGYDLKRDVGLVSFRPGVPVTVARLAPPGYSVKTGDPVLSIGCDNGREPSVRNSHVTSTDKFLPPPNIQVAGQPVEGRSGGGLFTAAGLLVGVCNAADPTDNEGLYAGLGSIHGEIARKGLTEMMAAPVAAQPNRPEPTAMAQSMPVTNMNSAVPRVVPTSSDDPRGPIGGPAMGAPLTPAEQSVLEKVRGTSGDAEVICIIKPLKDPHAMSEIVVVDRASQDLLRQLAAERRTQTAKRIAPPGTQTSAAPQPVPARADLTGAAHSWQPNTGVQRFR